jgi:ligand-binding sensor domain-containing protein
MKKIYQLIFISIFLSASNTLISEITTTNNFQNLTVADGLIDDDVTDVLIQNDSTIWIATSAGLSHYDGVNFSNYSAVGSNLNNDNISELEYCQNKIWMVTDSGISSFDGTTFANYSPSNGLISSSILGLASTSTDTLWMTSTLGSAKFDGTTFTNYPTQNGRDIETDSLDRVYVMRATVANPNFVEKIDLFSAYSNLAASFA